MTLMKTPRSLDIEITSKCNLRCRYCYFFNNAAVPYADLPADAWLNFFDECGRLGVMTVTLAGGEPFLRPDFHDLLTGIIRNRMRFAVLSNGALITDETARMIAASGRCDYVQISIDGSCAAIHDSCRGEGAFKGALGGLRILQQHKVPVTSRVTVHRRNVHDLEAIARLLLDELGLDSFSTNSAGYLGSCRLHSSDILLSHEERVFAMAELERLADRYDGRITATAGPLADARMWKKMKEASIDYGGRLTGCGCTYHSMAVRADGVMIPCSMLPHMELGRIGVDRLEDVWVGNRELKGLRERDRISLREFEYCRECEFVDYCTGNCPGLAYSLTGEVNAPSPDACLRRFISR